MPNLTSKSEIKYDLFHEATDLCVKCIWSNINYSKLKTTMSAIMEFKDYPFDKEKFNGK